MAASATPGLVFLSLLPFLPAFAADNVPLGSSITARSGDSSAWISPSGEFAFGFCQYENAFTFLLAIWYAKIPDKTIVWHANTTTSFETGSRVELTAVGLTLNDPNGQTIWKAEANTSVSQGTMLDTGNFVLWGPNSAFAWESFSYPTNTILPTQVLSLGSKLYSRITRTNYSRGRFELHFENGDLQLIPVAWPSELYYNYYYSSRTANSNASMSGVQVVFASSADIYILKGNGEEVRLAWQGIKQNPNNYYRATLDFDGVFRQYTYPRNSVSSGSWSALRYIPGDICSDLRDGAGSGVCGFNSYCIINSGTPSCQCPKGFSYMDRQNPFGGCKPNFPQGCGVDEGSRNQEDTYDLVQLPGLDWRGGDYERLGPYNQMQCELACLRDCSCAAATFSGTTCWKKSLPLSYGILNTRSLCILKVRKDIADSSNKGTFTKGKKILIWSLLFSSWGLFISLFLVVVYLKFLSRYHRESKNTSPEASDPETNLRVFTFKELERATDGFKKELGRGSFGIVYEGVIKYGSNKNQVAIKKLDKLCQRGEKEFKAEVRAIGKTHHKNLVELLGYCNVGPHRILVYEYMTNGSLAKFLFNLPKPDWHQRTQLALGIARGLVYLHEECNGPIIHCDIKPQNILIDECFRARISDFGIAKSLMFNQTQTHTGIRGTRGYLAPEWFRNIPVTVKVDVYSFGVVLLEIISCRKCGAREFEEENQATLVDWAYDCYMEGKLDMLVDNDQAALKDMMMLRRWVTTAIWCIQEDLAKRPTMKMVTQMLEGYVEVPIPPVTLPSH